MPRMPRRSASRSFPVRSTGAIMQFFTALIFVSMFVIYPRIVLYVKILDCGGVGLDEFFARQDFIAHEDVKNAVCRGAVFYSNLL